MKPTARFLYWCAALLILCLGQGALAASSSQEVAVAGGAYGFESAKAYLEMKGRDLTEAQGKFESDLFQNLDEANAINIKYRALPPNYVLYRLKLAENIEKNASKPDKLTAYCKEFLYIDNAERENADKFLTYNESMTEKLFRAIRIRSWMKIYCATCLCGILKHTAWCMALKILIPSGFG